ncbi:unnamed protein product [Pieris macdunnoughi]|uniref:Uncharacterized protein n=1 Tax=Pieris macdunnoughi TaxID=345717 RepID=A0A821PKC5_9NEOP|nr:unnamed protein product [Pieris macdunnoughi]
MQTIILIAALFGAVMADLHSFHDHGPEIQRLPLRPHGKPCPHPHKHQGIQRLPQRNVHQEPLRPIFQLGPPVQPQLPRRILHQRRRGRAPHHHHHHPSFQVDDDHLWSMKSAARIRFIMKCLLMLNSLNEAEDDNRADIGEGKRHPDHVRRDDILWTKVGSNQPKPERPSGNSESSEED